MRGERREPVHIESGREFGSGRDPFEEFRPPFDLEADMLFVLTAAPTPVLAHHFPAVRLLGVAGRTRLLLWFSRVLSLEHGPVGQRSRLDGSTGFGYNELNVVAPLAGRRMFVPVIYAGEGLTQRLGHRYGMPKRVASSSFAANERTVESTVSFERTSSEVHALLLASGRLLGKPLDWATPWWSWPAVFPGGSFVRARIQSVPRAQLAFVRGTLALDEPWLPRPVPLWPLGLYVPGLQMRLPAPVE